MPPPQATAPAAASASSALVVDPNPTSRNVLSTQLRELGVTHIDGCGRLADAQRSLEQRRYDVVLCEQSFPGEDGGGNGFLDELRQGGLLPLSTVFIIVSGEATHDGVTEAAESSLDGYLVKPYTGSALAERIRHAQRRKQSLKDINAAIERGDFASAAHLCVHRFAKREAFWMYCARVGAELLLRLNRSTEARKLLEAVLSVTPHPWARLAIARCELQAQRLSSAVQLLQQLVADHAELAEAWDVLGRSLCEQGEFSAAVKAYQRAVSLTPYSSPRLQRCGLLSFMMGNHGDALQLLDRAVHLGNASRMFDAQSLAALALIRYAQRDGKALRKCIDRLEHRAKRTPDDERLQHLLRMTRICGHAMAGHGMAQADDLERLFESRRESDFGSDLGALSISLLAHMGRAGQLPDEAAPWVQSITRRFCVSHGMAEILALAAAPHPPLVQVVREAQQHIMGLAEAAMKHTLEGRPQDTAEALARDGRDNLNTKLLDLAKMVLDKHAARIALFDELLPEVEMLRNRYARAASMPGIASDAGRAPGALMLRVANTQRMSSIEQA